MLQELCIAAEQSRLARTTEKPGFGPGSSNFFCAEMHLTEGAHVPSSDSHRHQDVSVFHILVSIFWSHLTGALGIFELQTDFTGITDCL